MSKQWAMLLTLLVYFLVYMKHIESFSVRLFNQKYIFRHDYESLTSRRPCRYPFHRSPSMSKHDSSTHGTHGEKDDDPWAAYTLHTDEEDEDSNTIDDDDAWLDQIPGARALAQDPSLAEFSSSTSTRGDKQPFVDPSNTLIKDHFYSSFDDEKFITLQKEYSAKARGMTVPEYEQWERNVKQSAADAVTGDQAYVQTQQVERKSTWITSLQQHLDHQQKVFDTMSSTFYQMEEDVQRVQPVLKHVTKRAIQQMMESIQEGQGKRKTTTQGNHNSTTLQGGGQVYQLLDVGCGTGSLFPHLLQAAKDAKIRFHLTGVDLSPQMIEYAKIHAENLLDDFPSGFQFDFEAMDFVQMVMGSSGYDCGGDDGLVTGYYNNKGPVDDTTMKHKGKYDAVLFNSCFGNFFDPVATLSAAVECLRPNGILVIIHPLGAEFVRKLNEEDPDSVPHHLPTILDFRKLARAQPLLVLDFIEDVDLLNVHREVQNFELYYASARKTPYRPLRSVLRLRGKVDKGYGRGGKKLGFPTANLPSRLFSNALEHVPNGVYFGWAVIEDGKSIRSDIRTGRNTWHKAVVNVGLSPTFAGEENREKIVEAHLIVEEDEIRGDFYNETMRLALSGFLRPEMKFNSFADLIAAITNDVANAKEALGVQPFVALRADSFLTDPCKRVNNTMVEKGQMWIGKSGGDEMASWELEFFETALRSTPMARWVI